MNTPIYITSDGSLMGVDDLIYLLKYYLTVEEYKHWSFDEITGGKTEFIDYEQYEKVKNTFKSLEK